MSTSLTGVYVPFHLGISAVEPHFAFASGSYDPASAYWLFTELAKLADYGYSKCIETITATWQKFEAEHFQPCRLSKRVPRLSSTQLHAHC